MQNHILENQNTKQENQNPCTQLIHSLIYGFVKWVGTINYNKSEHCSVNAESYS